MIQAWCLVQVSSGSVTHAKHPVDERALKNWFKRGFIHLIGSDGHSPRRRPPLNGDAYRIICRWTGVGAADRICSSNGLAVLQGMVLRVSSSEPKRRWCLPRFW